MMENLATDKSKYSFLGNLSILFFHPIIILGYILITGVKSNALPWLPTAASIDSVSGSMQYHQGERIRQRVDNSNKSLFRLSGGPSRQLAVFSGSAGLGFLNRSGKIGSENLIRANARGGQPTHYYYPCNFLRRFTIGWKPGDEKAGGGGCEVAILQGEQAFQSLNFVDPNVAIQPFSYRKIQVKHKNQLQAQALGETIRHCSAVSNSGQAWGAVISNSLWDILSPDDPCEQAVRQCELNSGDRSCLVASMGENSIVEPNKTLTAVLKCGNEVDREKNDLAGLNQWLLSRSQNGTAACTLHVLDTNDRLVFPTTDQTTVINTYLADNGKPQIEVLAGEVRVVPADPELSPSTLTAGQACIPFLFDEPPLLSLKQLRPQLVAQNGGVLQVQQIPVEACQVLSLDQDERSRIYNSQEVQSFINFENWSLDLRDDIEQYKEDVNQEFFNPNSPN